MVSDAVRSKDLRTERLGQMQYRWHVYSTPVCALVMDHSALPPDHLSECGILTLRHFPT